MEPYAYISPPLTRTPIKRMIDPRPYNTDPIRPLPKFPWEINRRDELQTPTRQVSGADSRPYNTDPIRPLLPLLWPRERRAELSTTARSESKSDTRLLQSDALSPFSPLPSPTPVPRTPAAQVIDAETFTPGPALQSSSPIASPRLGQEEWTPPTHMAGSTPYGFAPAQRPPVSRIEDEPLQKEVPSPGRKMVRFRNTPSVHEVERVGWRPVREQRKQRNDKRRFRVDEMGLERRPIFPGVAKKLASGLAPWAWCIGCLAVFLALVTRWSDDALILQPDLRPRIPPEFLFKHRDFRKQAPEVAVEFEYITKAARAGMDHLEQVIQLNKEAKKSEKVDGSKSKEWQYLTRSLDVVKIKWDKVLHGVVAEEQELIKQSKAWYDTKAAAQSTLHDPRMASLKANDRRKAREGLLEDVRRTASFSAKAIENQARYVNASLETAERNVGLYLPSGCGPWEDIILGPEFEEDKPRYLSRLPQFYTKLAPTWSCKWLEKKRRRMQLCAKLEPHLSYFQDFVRIVSLSNEHLREAARDVEKLAADSPLRVDDMSPASISTMSKDYPDGGSDQTPSKESNEASDTPVGHDQVDEEPSPMNIFTEGDGPTYIPAEPDEHEARSPEATEAPTSVKKQGSSPLANGDRQPFFTTLGVWVAGWNQWWGEKYLAKPVINGTMQAAASFSNDQHDAREEDEKMNEAFGLDGEMSPTVDSVPGVQGDAGPRAKDNNDIPVRTINDISSRRDSYLVDAARAAEEKRKRFAVPAPAATIDDVFRAWNKIVGGLSSVIEKEFRA
ncbi:hypothetical protein IWX46DRAFT_643085 [Phyllosticta citricarpa]|uniref:Uncharacterized protein n=1 Tax=Phyllosticta citricarpa TaxID=55181 RepID=A0ABR1LTD6_9PEZI